MPKQNVPALRLEGFDGEWEESTIGSQAEIVMGQSPHGSSYNTKSAGEVLVQGNADLVDGWVTPRIWTTEPTRIAEPGTLIMSVRAPVGAMGKTRHRVVLGRGVAGIRGNEFIFQYLTKLEQDSYWSSKSSGSTFDSVNGSEIRATQISVPPTLEEQQAIGAIFTNLDAAINQHTLKHTFLQQSKTALMQRMFPQEGQTVPELRLEGFDGEWEEKRLVDEVSFFSGLTYTPSDVVEHDGTLVLRSSNVQDGVIATKDCVYVRTDAVNVQNVRKNDIIMVVRNGSRSLIGKHAVVQKPMPSTVIGAFITGIRSDQPWFINALFDTGLFKYEVDKSMGATINQITGGMFAGMSFFFPPTLEEQQAIGAVFTNLDQLIAAEAQYIASLKQAKTALLQRMFI